MNNKELELIGESIWNTYRSMAHTLLGEDIAEKVRIDEIAPVVAKLVGVLGTRVVQGLGLLGRGVTQGLGAGARGVDTLLRTKSERKVAAREAQELLTRGRTRRVAKDGNSPEGH